MNKYLLSLPPNLVSCFHKVTNYSEQDYFCTSDPINKRLGSGGGTIWLLNECHKADAGSDNFSSWLSKEKKILLHAGGQSRRLPAYAPSGKILTPIPIFRWKRGQAINQNLLSLQLSLYDEIMDNAPEGVNTLVASGDIYVRTTREIGSIPKADVVCYGLWVEPSLAKNHGVFMIDRKAPEKLDYMLQKPSTDKLAETAESHLFLMDIGIWLLSDKAVEVLKKKCVDDNGNFKEYDLYGTFGCALGQNPSQIDEDVSQLSVAIQHLNGGEFYHYGTSGELISSTTSIQNLVKDQRFIIQKDFKKQPSVFTQNSKIEIESLTTHNNIWIENSNISKGWDITERNIITGIPNNNWNIRLEENQCVDIVPIGEFEYVLRPYGYNDKFRGNILDDNTEYLDESFNKWLLDRNISKEYFSHNEDIQISKIFPVSSDIELLGRIARWMLSKNLVEDMRDIYLDLPKLSADDISNCANLMRLEEQRRAFRNENMKSMADNYSKSVFYQSDLKIAASIFASNRIELPKELNESTPIMTRIHDTMFRSEHYKNIGANFQVHNDIAFRLLSESITSQIENDKQRPSLGVCTDQIVWGRCPVRIDLAGGWTDTPPYSLISGGSVVNVGILLNGQPPLQVYIKPCKEFHIICRSIDLGAEEKIETYDELSSYNKVGSPFSIPKAALSLAGFLPKFSEHKYKTLRDQLKDFGSGIEITLLSAIPAGSGLGTSSILASTVLGALSNFCNLGWDNMKIGNRTLILEQLLTTGGGWQDQYGGILSGVKLLQTTQGFEQTPTVSWLPNNIFNDSDYAGCHLLYYTGITRTAKSILAEIVRGMFLNSSTHLQLLEKMKQHSLSMADAISKNDFYRYGQLLRKTWEQNKKLDSGTEPESIKKITKLIDDLCLGYKLPGAGGGGYLYMVAKDIDAARHIRKILNNNPINSSARFVNLSLSDEGFQVTRS